MPVKETDDATRMDRDFRRRTDALYAVIFTGARLRAERGAGVGLDFDSIAYPFGRAPKNAPSGLDLALIRRPFRCGGADPLCLAVFFRRLSFFSFRERTKLEKSDRPRVRALYRLYLHIPALAYSKSSCRR